MSFYVRDELPLDDPDALEASIGAVFESRQAALAEPESEPEVGGDTPSEDQPPVPTPGPEPVPTVPDGEPSEPATEAGPEPDPEGFVVGDRTFAPEQAEQLLGLWDWVDKMDPRFAEDIGRLASGEFTLTPREQAIIAAQEEAAPPPPPPDPLADADLTLVPPEITQLLRDQQAQLAEMQAEVANVRGAALSANDYAAQQAFTQQANYAMAQFGERHNLPPELLDEISRAAATAVPLFSQTSNNATEIFDQALEHTLWTTPAYRAQYMTMDAQRAADETATVSQSIQDKVQNQAAINSSSGSVPRSEPSPRNLSPQERQSAMIAEVANYLAQP